MSKQEKGNTGGGDASSKNKESVSKSPDGKKDKSGSDSRGMGSSKSGGGMSGTNNKEKRQQAVQCFEQSIQTDLNMQNFYEMVAKELA